MKKKVIWKFPLEKPDNEILMPIQAEILTVQMQNNVLVLWALVDPLQSIKKKRIFRVFATGEESQFDNFKYIGTFQQNWFVGHVFEWEGL